MSSLFLSLFNLAFDLSSIYYLDMCFKSSYVLQTGRRSTMLRALCTRVWMREPCVLDLSDSRFRFGHCKANVTFEFVRGPHLTFQCEMKVVCVFFMLFILPSVAFHLLSFAWLANANAC